jgi:hypothetical protein
VTLDFPCRDDYQEILLFYNIFLLVEIDSNLLNLVYGIGEKLFDIS